MKILEEQYSRDSDNDVFKRMYESIRSDNIEFEAVFEKIQKPKFIELLNICKNKFINLSETNSLDITVPNSNIRTSINGISSIKKYCKTNSLNDLNVEYMEKQLFTDKITYKPLYLEQYPIRINIKTEDNLDDGNSDVQDIKDKLYRTKKFMRYKKRFSFLTHDKMFRIDITAVKTGQGESFVKAEVLKQKEEYEVEIEFVGNNGEHDILPIDYFIEMFYSTNETLMENYEINIPDICFGNNNYSDFHKLEAPVKSKKLEISDSHEYSINDIGNNIFTSSPVMDFDTDVLSLIKQEYWHISERLWLLELVKDKSLKIEGIVTGDGDYKAADKNSEYYQVRITPPFSESDIHENLAKIKPEDRELILVDRKYIDKGRNTIITIPSNKKSKSIDTSKIHEIKKMRTDNIVIENILKVLDKYLEYLL
jgi:hypothetical protein